jgi:hypothetical protein
VGEASKARDCTDKSFISDRMAAVAMLRERQHFHFF